MFGLSFADKVRKVLRYQFQYPISKVTLDTFNSIVKSSKYHGCNEIDAAIMFMLVMINSLSSNQSNINFVAIHIENINRIKHLSKENGPSLEDLIFLVKDKFGLLPPPRSEHANFETWYRIFKEGCCEANPFLRSDDDSSLVDYLENTPLRRAHQDGEEPRVLGRMFAMQTDLFPKSQYTP